jgi:hypothetical protein
LEQNQRTTHIYIYGWIYLTWVFSTLLRYK